MKLIVSTEISQIPGAEHDIPPLTQAAKSVLEGVDPLDPEIVAAIAFEEDDPLIARELRSRALMLKAGAGPADSTEIP